MPLRLDALKAAITEAKSGRDVSQYKQAWDCIRKLAPEEPEATRDEAWIDATEKSNKAETQRLESELKGYKNNLITESIRVILRHMRSLRRAGSQGLTWWYRWATKISVVISRP